MKEALDYLRAKDQSVSDEHKTRVESAFSVFCETLRFPGLSLVNGQISFLDTYSTSLRPHRETRVNLSLTVKATSPTSQLFRTLEVPGNPHFVPESRSLMEITQSFRSTSLYSNLMSRLSHFCDEQGINFSENINLEFTFQPDPDEPSAEPGAYVFRTLDGCILSLSGVIKGKSI